MFCSNCQKIQLNRAIFNKTEVDYCIQCLGIWFEQDELRQAKDEKDKELNWLDIDLWEENEKFKITLNPKICPACSVPMYEVNYGESETCPHTKNLVVGVDLCNLCQGIWLDRGEFKKIIDYLKNKGSYEAANNYFKNLIQEGAEIFTGPEKLKAEVFDFLTVLKLLNYKFAEKYPKITELILDLPK